MKILVISDVEGIYEIRNYEDIFNIEKCNREAYEALLTLARVCDASITFCDCHNNGGRSEKLSSIFPETTFVKDLWDINFENKYDYSVLIGFHSKSGTADLFSHTFRDEIRNVQIGLKEVGELEFFINLLNFFLIKTIFISCNKYALYEVAKVDCKILSHCEKDNSKSIDEFYHCFRDELMDSIANADKYSSGSYMDGELRVSFKNNNLYKFLLSIGYESASNQVVFYDTYSFYTNLKQLCYDINKYNYIREIMRLIQGKKIQIFTLKKTFRYFTEEINKLSTEELSTMLRYCTEHPSL